MSYSAGRGRGEYYRNKYGRGGGAAGAGRGSPGGNDSFDSRCNNNNNTKGNGGGSYEDLHRLLRQIDGRQYPSYHDLETKIVNNSLSGQQGTTSSPLGGWMNTSLQYILQIGRTQSDPFAPPTQCRVSFTSVHQQQQPQQLLLLPTTVWSHPIRRMATADFLWRRLYQSCLEIQANHAPHNNNNNSQGWNKPKGGDIQIMKPTQHVLEQSAVTIDMYGQIQCQMTINLPARGRTILGEAAWYVFNVTLGQVLQKSILCINTNPELVQQLIDHVDSVQDQMWLQNQLDKTGLVAFVRNGAILPRSSGVDDRPLQSSTHVVPFVSPSSLQTSFTLPNTGTTVVGMGLPKGITLICGGGFHGKSTLLDALQVGVYAKVPGDGREFCCTVPHAAKIRAEDGRFVSQVDISSFIRHLPLTPEDATRYFCTANASGSTSQASNIVEAVQVGCDVLLIDEDTAATNFMIRDNRMMQLVACDREPITPFVRVISSLKQQGISTILVVGGTGDFFEGADHVLVMDTYRCHDATERARQIVAQDTNSAPPLPPAPFAIAGERSLVPAALNPNGKVKVLAKNVVAYGDTEIDLSYLEQLVATGQTNAIAHAMQWLASNFDNSTLPFTVALAAVERSIEEQGLDVLTAGQLNGSLVRPRMLEISSAINRLRRAAFANKHQ